jgi:DNA-binding transcriptional ArsR family regulator
MLAALGHELRLRIVRLLLREHPTGSVAGEIAQELEIAPSTLSHHLDALQREGLIEQRREGRFVRYTAEAAGLEAVLRFLMDECCTGGGVVPLSELTRSARARAGAGDHPETAL